MIVLVLQTEAECGQALVRIVERELPELRGHVVVVCSEELEDEASALRHVEAHQEQLRLIFLDAHLKPGARRAAVRGFGLGVYKQIVLRRLFHIRVVITSFDGKEEVASGTEYGRLLEDDFISINPHLRLPVLAEQLGPVVRRLLAKEG
jgi:hypothetical protein